MVWHTVWFDCRVTTMYTISTCLAVHIWECVTDVVTYLERDVVKW